jgi:hypothetical protein
VRIIAEYQIEPAIDGCHASMSDSACSGKLTPRSPSGPGEKEFINHSAPRL